MVDSRGAGFCGSRLNIEGGNRLAEAYPESSIAYINEYVGADPSRWRTHIPAVTRVRYKNVYPGIDVVYYSRNGKLEYDFAIAPGGDPRRIRLSFEQVDRVTLDAEGNAKIGTSRASAALAPPVVYQERDGQQRAVTAHYVQQGPRTLGIEVGSYDRGQSLIVDPVLYATYLGGSGADSFNDVKLDAAGNMLVVGSTDSANFPRATGTAKGTDALVVKLNPAGTAVLFATYIGGAGTDSASKLSVDSTGAAYVLGSSGSSDFPYTSGAYRANAAAAQGSFIVKLSATGALVYSAQVQAASTSVTSIVADSTGRAIYAGSTGDAALPVTTGAYQTVPGGGSDGFIGALNASGSGLSFLTYLGGNFNETISALALDSSGAILVAGDSKCTNGGSGPFCDAVRNTLPITAGAYRSTYALTVSSNLYRTLEYTDSFVAKLNAAGTALVFSTFAPDAGTYGIQSLALDSANNVYVAGATSQFVSPTSHDERDFVAKLNPTATSLLYSTSIGQLNYAFGFPSLGVTSIVPDAAGGLLAVGSTVNPSFPNRQNTGTPLSVASPYLVDFDAQGQPVSSSLFPVQSIGGLAVDSSNVIVLAGTATAGQLTSTAGALQANPAGSADGFIQRLTLDPCSPTATISPLSFPSGPKGFVGVSILGSIVIGNAPGCLIQLTSSAPWLTFDGYTNMLFSGSGTQAFSLDRNTDPAPRTVTVTAGATSVTVTQAGNSCSYTVTPASVTVGAGAGTGSVQVTSPAGCAWNTSTWSYWLSLSPSNPGSGNGTLTFTVAANTTGAHRVGHFYVADQLVTVTQSASNPGVPSLVSLTPFQGTGLNATLTLVYADSNSWSEIQSAEFIVNPRWESAGRAGGCYVKYAPGTGLFSLIADDGVHVVGTAAPSASTVLSNSQCSLNAANSSATGSGQTLTVVASLTFQPSFTGQRHIWMQAVDYNNASTNWLVYGVWLPTQSTVSAIPWYRIYDPYSGSYLYSADQNEYNTLGTRGFQQQGISGMVMDGSTTVGGISNMAWYRVYVNSTNSHFWTSDRNEFLTLINQQQAYVGEGVAAFAMPYLNALGQISPQVTNTIPFYRAAFSGKNLHYWTPDADEYFGRNSKHLPAGYYGEGIACYIFPVGAALFGDAKQDDGAPAVVSVVNGASYASSGVIAPGEVLSVFGRHLGGRVLLNGVPAKTVSTGENEIRVVVPNELAGASAVTLEVEHRGRRTGAVKLDMAQANPAIFGSNRFGRGNAQARNEEGSMNGADHPAARGSVVTLYTTGSGAIDLPVEVHIGGRPAQVIATQLSATQPGVLEVRVRVPETLEASPFQPVVLHVAHFFSQPGVGLAIQ